MVARELTNGGWLVDISWLYWIVTGDKKNRGRRHLKVLYPSRMYVPPQKLLGYISPLWIARDREIIDTGYSIAIVSNYLLSTFTFIVI